MSERSQSPLQPEAGFEILEHTADVGVRAWGPTLGVLFREAARGMFALITDLERVRSMSSRTVELEADAVEDLLHDWLEELNGLHQVRHEVYCGFDVETDGVRLRATVHGEPLDPARHELWIEIKAVTWHDLRVERIAGGFEAAVLLDI